MAYFRKVMYYFEKNKKIEEKPLLGDDAHMLEEKYLNFKYDMEGGDKKIERAQQEIERKQKETELTTFQRILTNGTLNSEKKEELEKAAKELTPYHKTDYSITEKNDTVLKQDMERRRAVEAWAKMYNENYENIKKQENILQNVKRNIS